MFNIDPDGKITLTRGDTASAPLFINMGTELEPVRYDVSLHTNNIYYFALMEPNQYFEDAILKQKYLPSDATSYNSYGDLIIRFNHDDTKLLTPGKYYYQIKALIKNSDDEEEVNTLIDKTEFFITE